MLKVKINVKNKNANNQQTINCNQITHGPKIKLNIKRNEPQIPNFYEDDEIDIFISNDPSQNIQHTTQTNKYPLHTLNQQSPDGISQPIPQTNKIAINHKNNESTQSKINTQTMVKINVKKKIEDPKLYKSLILDQKPIKKSHEINNDLSGKVNLESFFDEGIEYFIHWESKYIFPPQKSVYNNEMNFAPDVPIGKLIDSSVENNCINNAIPLIRRKIQWFYEYDLDVEIHH